VSGSEDGQFVQVEILTCDHTPLYHIGIAGMSPFSDYRGQYDEHGYELRATILAVADEIASAAELVMGKLDRRPVAVLRGYQYMPSETGSGQDLVMDSSKDLFR
jgi:coenzyme F420-0:L-glutamate ligase / coenzyme F420-1:gamma-L-glutamate ligase